jgi:hypothetical protein
LAREETGRKRNYKKGSGGTRAELMKDPVFRTAFDDARKRMREMDYRCVGEDDPTRQALLEIYSDANSEKALDRIAIAKRRIQSVLDRELVAHQKTLEQKIAEQGPEVGASEFGYEVPPYGYLEEGQSAATRMYVKCASVRFALHVSRGDRYAQHCFLLGATLDVLIERRFPFAGAPAWVKVSGADRRSGLGDSRTGGSAF